LSRYYVFSLKFSISKQFVGTSNLREASLKGILYLYKHGKTDVKIQQTEVQTDRGVVGVSNAWG